MYKSWMKAQYTSNLVWFSVNNISTWVVGAMYLDGLLAFGSRRANRYAHRHFRVCVALLAADFAAFQPLHFINAVAYLERIFEMIDEPVLVDDTPDATELPPIRGDVTFDDVTFSYDGSINVLEHFNLDVKGRVHRALSVPRVPAKDGRQPHLAFLQHQFRPGARRQARYLRVTLHSLRARKWGIMLQDSFIFSGTIMDNIRYGRLDATDEEIIAAAKDRACA